MLLKSCQFVFSYFRCNKIFTVETRPKTLLLESTGPHKKLQKARFGPCTLSLTPVI